MQRDAAIRHRLLCGFAGWNGDTTSAYDFECAGSDEQDPLLRGLFVAGQVSAPPPSLPAVEQTLSDLLSSNPGVGASLLSYLLTFHSWLKLRELCTCCKHLMEHNQALWANRCVLLHAHKVPAPLWPILAEVLRSARKIYVNVRQAGFAVSLQLEQHLVWTWRRPQLGFHARGNSSEMANYFVDRERSAPGVTVETKVVCVEAYGTPQNLFDLPEYSTAILDVLAAHAAQKEESLTQARRTPGADPVASRNALSPDLPVLKRISAEPPTPLRRLMRKTSEANFLQGTPLKSPALAQTTGSPDTMSHRAGKLSLGTCAVTPSPRKRACNGPSAAAVAPPPRKRACPESAPTEASSAAAAAVTTAATMTEPAASAVAAAVADFFGNNSASSEAASSLLPLGSCSPVDLNYGHARSALLPTDVVPSPPKCRLCDRLGVDCIYGSDLCIANQLQKACHACDTPRCWHINELCIFFGRARQAHIDSQALGIGVPDIFARARVTIFHLEGGDDVCTYFKVQASGAGSNCLVYSLLQCIGMAGLPCSANVPWVRTEMMKQFTSAGVSAVTSGTYLDLCEHWASVVSLLGSSARSMGLDLEKRIVPSLFQITCISDVHSVIGDLVGTGRVHLYLFNEGNCHYSPLLPYRSS